MFSPIAGELGAADVAMVNLETAITDGGSPEPKAYNFRAPASALAALARRRGRRRDDGEQPRRWTTGPTASPTRSPRRPRACCPMVGIGNDAAEAYAPWQTVVKGQRISVIGATDVLDEAFSSTWPATDTQAGLASAKDAEPGAARRRGPGGASGQRHARRVPALGHRGLDLSVGPPAGARAGASSMPVPTSWSAVTPTGCRAAAASARAFVDYGLGNFVFYNESGESGRTGVLTVTATGRDVDTLPVEAGPHRRWHPAAAHATRLRCGGRPQWDAQRACTGLTP